MFFQLDFLVCCISENSQIFAAVQRGLDVIKRKRTRMKERKRKRHLPDEEGRLEPTPLSRAHNCILPGLVLVTAHIKETVSRD
jgi:hypothetical protein